VDLIKIDTEGAEVEVLKGAESILENDQPLVIVEIHTEENALAVWRLMVRAGYELERVNHPEYSPDDPLFNRHFWVVCRPMDIP
jgi:hypothetical protein